jgi:NADH-quinone oxidoreductase subunit E
MEKGDDKEILLNILNEVQDRNGYLSFSSLKKISEEQKIPLSKLYGVVKFYTMFKTEKQGKYVIELCGSPSCVLNKSRDIEKFLERELKIDIGSTTKDGLFSVYKVSCIGCCNEAPAMLVNGVPYTSLTVKRVRDLINNFRKDANTKRN